MWWLLVARVLSWPTLNLYSKKGYNLDNEIIFWPNTICWSVFRQIKKTMNTVQSMGNSASRRGLSKDRSTLDILEVFKLLINYLTNLGPIYIQLVRMCGNLYPLLIRLSSYYSGFWHNWPVIPARQIVFTNLNFTIIYEYFNIFGLKHGLKYPHEETTANHYCHVNM